MTDQLPDILQPESRESYESDTANYFRNVRDAKRPGPSADQLQQARPNLLTTAQEAAYADRVELAADKTKRSGARVNNSSAVPGVFFQSMRENSELIDEFTPGKFKPQSEMKPVDHQVAPTGFFEAAEAIIETMCIDCCEPFSPQQYTLGVSIATELDSAVASGHVQAGDTVLYVICGNCWEKAKELTKDKTPLVFVADGELVPEREIELAIKYGQPVQLHTGVEKTRGQLELSKRSRRMMETLYRAIGAAHEDSWVFVRNRKKEHG